MRPCTLFAGCHPHFELFPFFLLFTNNPRFAGVLDTSTRSSRTPHAKSEQCVSLVPEYLTRYLTSHMNLSNRMCSRTTPAFPSIVHAAEPTTIGEDTSHLSRYGSREPRRLVQRVTRRLYLRRSHTDSARTQSSCTYVCFADTREVVYLRPEYRKPS